MTTMAPLILRSQVGKRSGDQRRHSPRFHSFLRCRRWAMRRRVLRASNPHLPPSPSLDRLRALSLSTVRGRRDCRLVDHLHGCTMHSSELEIEICLPSVSYASTTYSSRLRCRKRNATSRVVRIEHTHCWCPPHLIGDLCLL